MLDTKIKIEICKEVIEKSGQGNDKRFIDSLALAVMQDRFLFELKNNEVIAFVTWEIPQSIDGKLKIFVENLWVDNMYRNGIYTLKIRTLLRNMFKDTRGVWFNRKKQKIVDRR